MSYQKLIALAEEFAQKTMMPREDEEVILRREKERHFFEKFQNQFRALLNEMEGDYISLKVKELDRPILQEFGKLFRNLLEIYKKFNNLYPFGCVRRLINYVQDNHSLIIKLNNAIQKFLKENQIDFGNSSKLQQVRVDSLLLLNKLAMYAKSFMIEQLPNVS